MGKENFPFVASHEIMCIMFMYGKRTKIDEKTKIETIDLARQTVDRIHLRVEGYKRNLITKMNTEYIRSGYLERELQIRTEENRVVSIDRIANDPVILCSCFEQHVSYYNQTFFFQIYGPLGEHELLKNLGYLAGTMIMLGYNRKNEESLPFQHAIIPLYVWMRDHQIHKK
jgi:hypothetical protein